MVDFILEIPQKLAYLRGYGFANQIKAIPDAYDLFDGYKRCFLCDL